ncbi:MAG: hypothetical protein V1820_06025 [archaeon]
MGGEDLFGIEGADKTDSLSGSRRGRGDVKAAMKAYAERTKYSGGSAGSGPVALSSDPVRSVVQTQIFEPIAVTEADLPYPYARPGSYEARVNEIYSSAIQAINESVANARAELGLK